MKELWIPGPGRAWKDHEDGKGGDGRPGGKWADLAFKDEATGRIYIIQTVDLDRNGKPTAREIENAEAIRRAIKNVNIYLIPKPHQVR